MTRKTERLALPAQGIGTQRHLTIHRYGSPGARPKAYFQGALHADEIPGMMVAHHLARLLDEAAAAGGILGEIVLLPYANPIGLAQFMNGDHVGRYDLRGGGNFNRNWPDLFEPLAGKVEGRLGTEPAANVALIRAALRGLVSELKPAGELAALRQFLLREAIDADLVFDMHCDDEALLYLFTLPAFWPEAGDIAAELGCDAVLLADPSGGTPFDETFSSLWTRLAARFPDHPIPLACLSTTLELRGRAEVSDTLAEADAAALFRVLQRRGLVAGEPRPLPEHVPLVAPFEAVDTVKAPASGMIAYKAELGAQVRKGEVIAEIVDPAGETPAKARLPVASGTDGLLLTRRLHKYVPAGSGIAKVVGSEPLAHRSGYLMED
ncbi:MAG: M14 family metallopeptidase [Rhodospirillales bacterium]|nr:M14 family metallopeptidase [Rhodospirillales bacterium]